MSKKGMIENIIDFCDSTTIHPKDINSALEAIGTTPLHFGCKIADLISRPQITVKQLADIVPELKEQLGKLNDRK